VVKGKTENPAVIRWVFECMKKIQAVNIFLEMVVVAAGAIFSLVVAWPVFSLILFY